MERITSRFGRQRMDQQPAGSGISRGDLLENVLKIALRLARCPIRGAGRQLLQVKAPVVFRMTVVATGVSRSILQEDRFDPRFEDLETKGMRRRRRRLHYGGVTVANPGSEYLPFRIL